MEKKIIDNIELELGEEYENHIINPNNLVRLARDFGFKGDPNNLDECIKFIRAYLSRPPDKVYS